MRPRDLSNFGPVGTNGGFGGLVTNRDLDSDALVSGGRALVKQLRNEADAAWCSSDERAALQRSADLLDALLDRCGAEP